MERLAGKVAIITGAAQGMGESHARTFVGEGARVVMTDMQSERGQAIADELGDSAHFVSHDVASSNDWARVLAETLSHFGSPQILVNNAGIIGPVHEEFVFPEEDFRRVFEVNELGVFLGMCAVIPSMKENGGGSIVNISSMAGMVGPGAASNAAYVSTKFAVRGMTKYAAVVHGKHNIRVNSVHPGVIKTPMMAAVLNDEGGALADAIPMGRMADPVEVSRLVVFLASDDSSYITGEEHVIDGGLIAG